MTTREDAIHAATVIFAHTCFERDAKSPRNAAEDIWYPGHRLTIDEIEALLIEKRRNAEALWAAGTHPLQLRQQLPRAA